MLAIITQQVVHDISSPHGEGDFMECAICLGCNKSIQVYTIYDTFDTQYKEHYFIK